MRAKRSRSRPMRRNSRAPYLPGRPVRNPARWNSHILDLPGSAEAGNPEHIFRERRQSEPPQPEVKSEEDELAGVNPALLAFLDTDDFEEKYKILCGLEQRGEVTNHLIDQFAVTLDLVIPEGDADDRFVQLKNCVRTRSHFETNRLR